MESYSMDNLKDNGHRPHLHSGFVSAHFPETTIPMTPQETEQPTEDAVAKTGTRAIVRSFFHYTTINGLQRMASATTIIGRLFWIAVVLGALAMFSRDLYDLIVQYKDRPVSVVSKINYFKKMRFPSITICNVNPIRGSALDIFTDIGDRIKKRQQDNCFREDERNSSCDDDVDQFGNFDDQIYYLMSQTNESVLRDSGHQHDKLLVSCRFDGLRCRKKKYWTHFWNPHFGNCFTFNGNLRESDPTVGIFSTKKPGNANGLKLVLNIEAHEYIPELTEDAGVKLVLGDPREMPFPLYESISLAPGINAEVSVKRIEINRVDRFNNGSCRDSTVLQSDNPYLKKYNVSYTIQACLHHCYSQSQIKECGCAEYAYLTATPGGKVCDESIEETEDCLETWGTASGSCDQLCREPCKETIYEPSISFTTWPTLSSVQGVLQSYGLNYSDYDMRITNVRSNLLSVNIFFQRFRETQIEETLTYGTANLLADIGGQIGLWAGLSVISLCELIELTALILRNLKNRPNTRS